MKEVEINTNAADFDEYSFSNQIKKNNPQTDAKEEDVVSQSLMTEPEACGFYNDYQILIVDDDDLPPYPQEAADFNQ